MTEEFNLNQPCQKTGKALGVMNVSDSIHKENREDYSLPTSRSGFAEKEATTLV